MPAFILPVCPPQCDDMVNQRWKEGKSDRNQTSAVGQVSDSRALCQSFCIIPFNPHSPMELVFVLVVLLLLPLPCRQANWSAERLSDLPKVNGGEARTQTQGKESL